MRKTSSAPALALCGLLFGALTLSCSSSSSSSPPNNFDGGGNTIHVGPNGTTTFAPSTLTIHVGASVTWVWDSNHHTVTSGTVQAGVATPDNKFCSPNDQNCNAGTISDSGATYSHTFTTAGSYPFFCFPHAGAGMTGT